MEPSWRSNAAAVGTNASMLKTTCRMPLCTTADVKILQGKHE